MEEIIPKLVVLITGDRVVAGVKEVIADDGRPVCLMLRHPYLLQMIPSEEVDQNNNPVQYSVNFAKWNPYSSDDDYNIPYFSVITVSDVDPKILNIYLEKFGEKLYDNNTVSTSDSNDSSEESGVSDSGD
jgi:hypothetical protein